MEDGTTINTNLYVTAELKIENPEAGAASCEKVHWYLPPNIRHEITRTSTEIHPTHRDQLNALVMMRDDTSDWPETQYSNRSVTRVWIKPRMGREQTMRGFGRQVAETPICVAVLGRFTAPGMPVTMALVYLRPGKE